MAHKDRESTEWDNQSGVSRRSSDQMNYGRGDMGPEDFEDRPQNWGRERYYYSEEGRGGYGGESRARGYRGPDYGRTDANLEAYGGQGRGQQWRGQQGRGQDEDWARQVPNPRPPREYRDYGWESRESALPEFRDPSVQRMPYDEDEERRRGSRRSFSGRGQFSGQRSRGGGGFENDNPLDEYGRRGYDFEPSWSDTESWSLPGPMTGLGPRNYRRADERIFEDICERLTQHGRIDASDVEVQVSSGEVTLTGSVHNRQEKRLAEDIADSVQGVSDVHNQLRVGSSNQGSQGGQGTFRGSGQPEQNTQMQTAQGATQPGNASGRQSKAKGG